MGRVLYCLNLSCFSGCPDDPRFSQGTKLSRIEETGPISIQVMTCFWVLVGQQVSHCPHLRKTCALWSSAFFPARSGKQRKEPTQENRAISSAPAPFFTDTPGSTTPSQRKPGGLSASSLKWLFGITWPLCRSLAEHYPHPWPRSDPVGTIQLQGDKMYLFRIFFSLVCLYSKGIPYLLVEAKCLIF